MDVDGEWAVEAVWELGSPMPTIHGIVESTHLDTMQYGSHSNAHAILRKIRFSHAVGAYCVSRSTFVRVGLAHLASDTR